MSGRFLLKDGKMTISTPDGRTPFNTDDGLLVRVTPLSGSIAVAALTSFDGVGFNRTDDWVLGACHPACTTVIGGVKFTLGDQIGGAPYDRWTTVMGNSSIVWLQDGHGPVGNSPDPNLGPYQFIYYYFVIESAVVKLRRRAFCSSVSQGTYTVKGHTITYKVKAGLFS